MSKPFIKIEKLNKQIETSNSTIQVLKDINLNLDSGKIIAITGPSGSGKSTFYICLLY